MVTVPHDLALDDLLADLGYRTDAARQLARAALVDAGLTNGHKSRIALSKLDAVKTELAARFVLVCTRAFCRAVATTNGKMLVGASRQFDCGICCGSANESSIDRAIAALGACGMRRLVVVGGSPATHEELAALVHERLALRLVSGTDRRTSTDAKGDLAWADLVVIWGATQLDHKVSKLYTDRRRENVVRCGRRGIEALAETMRVFASRR